MQEWKAEFIISVDSSFGLCINLNESFICTNLKQVPTYYSWRKLWTHLNLKKDVQKEYALWFGNINVEAIQV